MDHVHCILKASVVECQTISLIDTLDQPSIDTQLILHQHLSWHLINTPLTTWPRANLFLINAYKSGETQPAIDQLLINCQSSVERVLIKYLSRCRMRVSIDTRPRMPLVLMIWVNNMFCTSLVTSSHSRSVSHPSESSLSSLAMAGDTAPCFTWSVFGVTDSVTELKACNVLSTFFTVAFRACIALMKASLVKCWLFWETLYADNYCLGPFVSLVKEKLWQVVIWKVK